MGVMWDTDVMGSDSKLAMWGGGDYRKSDRSIDLDRCYIK